MSIQVWMQYILLPCTPVAASNHSQWYESCLEMCWFRQFYVFKWSCMPKCNNKYETNNTFIILFVHGCMRCWSSSSWLSQEEIESPGPVLIDVLLCSEEATSVWVYECAGCVEGKGGQLFWNCPDGNGTEPKEDADRVVNSHTDTHMNIFKRAHIQQKEFVKKKLQCGWIMLTFVIITLQTITNTKKYLFIYSDMLLLPYLFYT